MPWNEAYYPKSMRNLPQEVRLKAIEIANALLEQVTMKVRRFALPSPKPRNGPSMEIVVLALIAAGSPRKITRSIPRILGRS
jgi:hypothetical protein